jgi:hypothetical protein
VTHHIDLGSIRLAKGATAGEGEDHGCVIFRGHIERNGYGKAGGIWAHRAALAKKLGRPIAPGMDACHTCDVRACVNPEHLYEGTRTRNILDSVERGRWNRPTGDRNARTVLSDRVVADVRQRFAAGETHKSQARRLGVHPVTISRIARGINRAEVAL